MFDFPLSTLTLPPDFEPERCVLSSVQQHKLRSYTNLVQSLSRQIDHAHQEAKQILDNANTQAQTLIEDEKRHALLDFMEQLNFIFEEIEIEKHKQWKLLQNKTLIMLEQALSIIALNVPKDTQLQAVIDLMDKHPKWEPILHVHCHPDALEFVIAQLSTKPTYSSIQVQSDDNIATDSLIFESRSGRYTASWKEAISSLSDAIRSHNN